MPKRSYNPRLAKIHRSYTVEEAACLYNVHKNTVRMWIKKGLSRCDDRRPLLILGSDLREFHQKRRIMNKRPCPPGTIYCFRCREPKSPVGNMVDYIPITQTKGNLMGICPCCDGMIYRLTSREKLEQIRTQLDISMPQAEQHISKCD